MRVPVSSGLSERPCRRLIILDKISQKTQPIAQFPSQSKREAAEAGIPPLREAGSPH
jgi:hypothetical protein